MPTLTIFAGINGAGKTSLYKWEKFNRGEKFLGERVNPDEILENFGGNWQSKADQYRSGKIAIDKIRKCLEDKKSFNWETTLISGFAISLIKKAKELGYSINLFFIGVDNLKECLTRIKFRVLNGGHGIDEDLITSRFNRQFNEIPSVLKLVDTAVFYRNDESLEGVATFANNKFSYVDSRCNWAFNLVTEFESSQNK